jgi:hypothetical protein
MLLICCADAKTAKYSETLVAEVKTIRWESRERNCTELKPYIFDKVCMFLQQTVRLYRTAGANRPFVHPPDDI